MYAYYNRANVSAMLKDYRAAIIDYDKAIELNPDFADAYLHYRIPRRAGTASPPVHGGQPVCPVALRHLSFGDNG